jgi:hypothetical protein
VESPDVVVTLTDIKVDIGKMSAKLDIFIAAQADHEARIRKLEHAIWIASGAAMAGSGALGSIISSFMP